jgi:hypothetical protein
MGTKHLRLSEEVTDFQEKALFYCPTGDGSYANGASGEEQFTQAGWRVYEWWIRLTNETANQLYRNLLVGGFAGSMFETTLYLRSIGDAISSAILGSLWPALELPTAGQVLRLSQDVATLRVDARFPARRHRPRQSKRWASAKDEGLRLTPNGNGSNRARDDHHEDRNRAVK